MSVFETTLRVEPVERLEAIQAEWSALAEASRNIFASWEWTSLWRRHFQRGRELAVTAAVDDDGRIVAILPLYLWRTRPGRVLRFLGHGVSDELGPICAPDARTAAADVLAGHLRASRDRWDVLLAENVPGGQEWGARLGATLLRRESNPVLLDDGGGWDGFLASRSRNFRQQVGRRERSLRRGYELRYRLADEPERLSDDLDTLFALHGARWADGRSSFGGGREAFHRDFAACALERGWLRLWFLELDGRPVAAWHGFRFAGVESYYQAGRDPAWDHASVGFVLLAHSIRAALADGVGEYRLLRGDDPYKARFATEDRPLETLAAASGRRGRALVAAATALRAAPRVRKVLRAPLEA